MSTAPQPSAQHTAGPWKAVLDETSENPLMIFQDDGTGNGDHIKLVAGDPETEANLRLIAAAPDLLRHLAILAAEDSQCSLDWVDQKKAARAAIAIAKATQALL